MCHNSQQIPSATSGGGSYRAEGLRNVYKSYAIQSTDANIEQQAHICTQRTK